MREREKEGETDRQRQRQTERGKIGRQKIVMEKV